VTSNHIFIEKKWKRRKKTKNCAEWWKRKDGVEAVESSGLVNKHIFWRIAGVNALEGQGYEFMTVYDTIVSMGVENMYVSRITWHGVHGGGGREWGHQ
jgi:hypothetical protein